MNKAIGLIEVVGLTNAIIAADESLKAANVNLLGIEKVSGGIVTVKLIGDVGAVMSAVEAGKDRVEHSGSFRSSHVIPRLQEEVMNILEINSKDENEKIVEEKNIESDSNLINIEKNEVTEPINDLKEENQGIEENHIQQVKELEKDKTNDKDKLLKLTVKELRKLAISTKTVKTWREVKALKKEDLIDELLNK